jgi:hypothetical protein
VTWPDPDPSTAVTLSTAAVASAGTPKEPATASVTGVPGTRVSPDPPDPLHWAAVPDSPDGSPGRVSQIRTGADAGTNESPLPPAVENHPETSTSTSVAWLATNET